MRLALITPGFSADEQDWCIPVLLDLVRELARQHEVHVFTLRYPQRQGTYQIYGATVHALGGGQAGGVRRIPLLTRALAEIIRQAGPHAFDLLHGLWADEPGFLAVLAGRLLNVPAIVSLLGGELVGYPEISYGGELSRVNRWMARWCLPRAACVTAGSTSLCRLADAYLAARCPSRTGSVQWLPLGVDTRIFHPAAGPAKFATASVLTPVPGNMAAGEIKLLHVASLVEVKDQVTLIRAFAQARERLVAPDVHLHIVGAGPLREFLSQLVLDLGIGEHVTFHGSVSHENLPAYYRAADLCVISSRFESQGMVLLEAAACGRGTVGTAVGLLPDLAPATVAVPIGDPAALAAALVQVLAHPKVCAAMGQMGLKMVQSRFTLEHQVAELAALYRKMRVH
ncbi:MAG: glycosyltransferase family 4 protein [Chloroflexi bacterium]|nr:glycosyltransferase family 4 protein [Chloroflexota bacterium]